MLVLGVTISDEYGWDLNGLLFIICVDLLTIEAFNSMLNSQTRDELDSEMLWTGNINEKIETRQYREDISDGR